MRRVREVISASLLAGTAVVALAVSASASTPSGVGHAACLPRGAHTLAADRVAVAFSWHGSVWGCLAATGERRNLAGAGFCNRAPGRAAPVRLAGEVVVYGLASCGVDTGSSTVVVLDLATGKRLADLTASTLPIGPESYVSVESLVLRADGAVGWIAHIASLVGRQGVPYEVHRFSGGEPSLLDSGGKPSLLDSGPAIRPASLRLAGSTMTWRDGNSTRSASLK